MLLAASVLFSGCLKLDFDDLLGKDSDNNNQSTVDDTPTNPLIGTWSMEPVSSGSHYSRSYVYDFINNNTVVYYGKVWDYNNNSFFSTQPVPGHSGWYYFDEVAGKTYTYTMTDNKVYVTDGKIMTYMNNQLLIDGESQPLVRWY